MNAFLKKKNLKLSFSPAPKNFSVSIKKVIIIVFISSLCIVFFNIFSQQIKNAFYITTSPLQSLLWGAGNGMDDFFSPFFNAKNLLDENAKLKKENIELLYKISDLRNAVKKEVAVQEIIQNTKPNEFKLALAQTIGLERDFILIDKGFDNGIFENMPVISSTKVLYGKVFKVYKNFSQVVLISNKNSVVDAKIQETNSLNPPILGAIRGDGNLSIHLDLVSSESEINQGDVLVSSGLEGIFPKDLLIGKITLKNQSDLKPFQTAQVQPFFDISNAENLFVITNYKEEK